MSRFIEALESRVLVCDGAMGTQLMAAGLQAGECSELWNVDYPGRVLKIQTSYAEAGADIIITNTFGGNRWSLAHHGREEELDRLNSSAVEIAREAAGESRFVAGDIGPTGELPLPYGTRGEEEFVPVFAEQAKALATAGVDVIFIETMTAVEELGAAVRAAKKATGLPVAASASYSPTADGTDYRTMMGVTVEMMVEAAVLNEADIIGANCGEVDIAGMAEIVRRIRRVTGKFVLVEPNAGKPVMERGQTRYLQTPEQMAAHVQALVDAGANIIGGCCGTTPEHIAAICAVVRG